MVITKYGIYRKTASHAKLIFGIREHENLEKNGLSLLGDNAVKYLLLFPLKQNLIYQAQFEGQGRKLFFKKKLNKFGSLQ